MDTLTLIYLIMGGMMMFALVVFILVIAGKDILFAFFRRFTKKYADVFVINPNRQVMHYYKKAKEGVFTIDKKMYITNPDKLFGISDAMKDSITKHLKIRKGHVEKKIAALQTRKEAAEIEMNKYKNNQENAQTINQYKQLIVELDNKIDLLKSKLDIKEENYYFNRRGAYFYIEGDPIPKDFHTWMSDIDSTQLENLIIRAQSKDPRGMKDIEKTVVWLKRFVIFILIGVAVIAFFAIKNQSALNDIAQNLGVQLSI